MKCERVPVSAIYAIRHRVLRPSGTPEDCRWEGDDAADHWAIVHQNKPLCVASFYLRPFDGAKRAVQLRGMATEPEFRGKGYGQALVKHCAAHYGKGGIELIWCNARKVAVDFYGKLGFQIYGEPFMIDGVGIHYKMFKRLNS